jgi:alginate O-acetyltransferase complex protein AlgI
LRIGFDFVYDFFNPLAYFADLLILCLLLVPAYRLLPSEGMRRALLILAGIYLLFVVAPRLVVLYVPFWILAWAALHLLARTPEGRRRQAVLAGAVLAVLAPLVLWKLFPTEFIAWLGVTLHGLIAAGSARLAEVDFVKDVFIPVGLSFAVFRAVDLFVQVHIGLLAAPSLGAVLFYGFFPPAFVVGPLVEMQELSATSPAGEMRNDVVIGVQRVVIGLVKLVVLTAPLQWSLVMIRHFDQYGPGTLVGGLVAFTWFFYLNFSGYSDIALGSARLFGFRLKENFDFPFFQADLQRFWASWHMSLTRFAQRNIFMPAGGYRKQRQYVAVLATMLVIALWHDVSLPLLIFGLYHGAGLALLRFLQTKDLTVQKTLGTGRGARLVAVLGTYIFVALSFPLLVLPGGQLVAFYRQLLP